MKKSIKKIGVIYSILLFLVPGIIFWVHLNQTIQLLTKVFGLSVYAAWLISGTFLLFLPLLLLVPLVAYKTRNTSTAIVIHFLLGAPMQIMVVFGIIS